MLISLLTAFLALPSYGNGEVDSCRVWVGLHGGLGYASYCDRGVGAVLFSGVEMVPELSLVALSGGWRHEVCIPVAVGGYWQQISLSVPESWGVVPSVRYALMKGVKEWDGWRLMAGGGIEERFDLRYNSSLGNNSVGTSNFVLLNMMGRVDRTVGRWLFHTEVAFAPVSLVLRPGFAYIANYDHTPENPVEDHFKMHKWGVVVANGVEMSTGAMWRLGNGNGVGVDYVWRYVTSREYSGSPHRFHAASHMLRISVSVAL